MPMPKGMICDGEIPCPICQRKYAHLTEGTYADGTVERGCIVERMHRDLDEQIQMWVQYGYKGEDLMLQVRPIGVK